MICACMTCGADVELDERTRAEYLPSAQERLAAQGDRALDAGETVRCADCYQRWSQGRSARSIEELHEYRRLCGEYRRGAFRRHDHDKALERESFLLEVERLAGDWHSDARNFAADIEKANAAARSRRAAGADEVPE